MANKDVFIVSVLGGSNLHNTELFTRQDPYVIVEYGGVKHRTRTADDGGVNPAFNDKFTFNLIPNNYDISVVVWNENVTQDKLIGSARINISRALGTGIEEINAPLYTTKQVQKGNLRVLIDYPAARNKAPANPGYGAPYGQQPPSQPAKTQANPYAASAPPPPSAPNPYPPSAQGQYPPPAGNSQYPPQGAQGHHPAPGYPPQGHPPQGHPPQGHPPQGHPPASSAYPAPPNYGQGHPPPAYAPQPGYAPPPTYGAYPAPSPYQYPPAAYPSHGAYGGHAGYGYQGHASAVVIGHHGKHRKHKGKGGFFGLKFKGPKYKWK